MFAQLVTKLIENVDLYTRRVISFRLTLEHSSPLLLLPHRYPIDTPSIPHRYPILPQSDECRAQMAKTTALGRKGKLPLDKLKKEGQDASL